MGRRLVPSLRFRWTYALLGVLILEVVEGAYWVKTRPGPEAARSVQDQFTTVSFTKRNPPDPVMPGLVTNGGGAGVAGVTVELDRAT